MKKIIRNASIALFAAVASFGMMGCPGPDPDPDPDPGPQRDPSRDIGQIHDMILPAGTGVTIPAWSKAADGVNGLPDVVTQFTTEESKFTELNGKTNRTPELKAAVKTAVESNFFNNRPAKNVIIVFADGWGESHNVGARQYYGDLFMDELPYHAAINHDSYLKASSTVTPCLDEDVTSLTTTDSTAGGSAINTGFTTRYGYSDLDVKGTEVKNLAELAREKGMLVGNVTNDCAHDATPETVLIHHPTRYDSSATDAKQFLASPDFQMGRYGYGSLVSLEEELHDITSEEDGVTYALFDPWYAANRSKIQEWSVSMLKQYDGMQIADASTYNMANWAKDRKMVAVKHFSNLMSCFTSESGDGCGPDKRYVVEIEKSHEFKYDESKVGAPKLGYKLGYNSDKRQKYPNYAEMVASTLYILDTQAKANGDCGFFCLIENTCPDGWGHAKKPYDAINEAIMTDEGIAVAVKYVLENPDTLLVVTADHETGGITYKSGWDTDFTLISASTSSHSSKPIPVFAFGAKSELWSDCPKPDYSNWAVEDFKKFAAGSMYPDASDWRTDESAQPSNAKFPKMLRNRTTGIRISKAMGFKNFGDLNGNGILDPETESDSVVDYKAAGSALQ